MSKTAYNITLKGYVRGADFDRIHEYWDMCDNPSAKVVLRGGSFIPVGILVYIVVSATFSVRVSALECS